MRTQTTMLPTSNTRCHSSLNWSKNAFNDSWFFIAGDAKQLPEAVTQVLKDTIEKHGGLSSAEVNAYSTKIEATKRFQM